MITTYERGKADGIREMLLTQLKKKFGNLPPEVQQRIAGLKEEQLRQISESIIDASSLKELHLED